MYYFLITHSINIQKKTHTYTLCKHGENIAITMQTKKNKCDTNWAYICGIYVRWCALDCEITKMSVYNLASVLSRGASFCVSMMLPAIFNLPFMKAAWGFSLPKAMSTMSSSATVSVVSTLTPWAGPSYALALLQSRAVN